MQTGRAGGEHVDALVQVVVAGRDTDLVVGGELPHPGAVEKPAQHQDRLIAGGYGTGAGPGSPPRALSDQKPGQEVHGVLARRQHGGVSDTHRRRRTLMKLICRRTTFIPGFCVFSTYPRPSGAARTFQTSAMLLQTATGSLRGMAH